MRLDSAIDLRDEVLEQLSTVRAAYAYALESEPYLARTSSISGHAIHRAAGSMGLTSSRRSSATVAARRDLARRVAPTTPAVGVAISSSGDYRLAVRVAQPKLLESPLVERIRRQASGEIDVRVTGRVSTHVSSVSETRSRTRPIRSGSSIGQGRTTGTLGCFVQFPNDPAVHALSANHVIAGTNRRTRGDLVTQPSIKDGGSVETDSIGSLDHIVWLEEREKNPVDAASCMLAPDIEYTPDWKLNCKISGLLPSSAIVGNENVEKWGRTTGFTRGRITAIRVNVPDVAYPSGLYLTLTDQLEIEGDDTLFSQAGDSGALIVRSGDQTVVAQLNGGDEYGYSFASPMSTVLGTMGATLVL